MKETKNKVGRPLKYKTNDELKTKIDEYFNNCYITKKDKKGIEYKENIRPLTILGMCLYLDISRETLREYMDKEDFVDTIKKAKMRIESYAEDYLFESKNPAGVIFNLKNNFNWKDKQEIETTNKTIIVEKPEFE